MIGRFDGGSETCSVLELKGARDLPKMGSWGTYRYADVVRGTCTQGKSSKEQVHGGEGDKHHQNGKHEESIYFQIWFNFQFETMTANKPS
jgi:hypothetical protein